jgi:hypothetical protein
VRLDHFWHDLGSFSGYEFRSFRHEGNGKLETKDFSQEGDQKAGGRFAKAAAFGPGHGNRAFDGEEIKAHRPEKDA